MVTPTSKLPKLELNLDVRIAFDDKAAEEAVVTFSKLLQADRVELNEAFVSGDSYQVWFLAEKLLGAVLYFNVPYLQLALKEVMKAAHQSESIPQEVIERVNKEIDYALEIANF
jgi:hypothetical protein